MSPRRAEAIPADPWGFGGEEQCDQRDEREHCERDAEPIQAGLLVLIQNGLRELLAREASGPTLSLG
jgi:hypothetical protein